MDRTITIGDYRFNEKAHLHELLKDGEYKPLTGVTTVLGVIAKPMLIQWAANQACIYIEENLMAYGDKWILKNTDEVLKEARVAHRKKKESAGEWGTNIHTKIEGYIKLCMEAGKPLPYQDEDIKHFVAWTIEHNVKFLASEKHVYSKRMWVGGICDIICEIDGKRYVGDIKTSSGIYPEAFIQCSAYAEMLREMSNYDKFDGVLILNLKKDGTFDYKYNYDLEGNFKCFEAALTIYRQLNSIK